MLGINDDAFHGCDDAVEPRRLPLSRFIIALTGGGDSRLTLDSGTGLNTYLCPATPDVEGLCVSSCTASPISSRGFARARAAYETVIEAGSSLERSEIISAYARSIEVGLTDYFGTEGLADVTLCPSGTDALLAAAMALAAESPGWSTTAILPAASETGTGVPSAVTCRPFDRLAAAVPAAWLSQVRDGETNVVHIPLRGPNGRPMPTDAVNAAYHRAAAAAPGRGIVYLTYGTKTGLVAPTEPPAGVEVVVDACQTRIAPALVTSYLRRGWPVVVTGSKFFGGPAFSGALLFPTARRAARGGSLEDRGPAGSTLGQAAKLGMVLRWLAALAEIEAFTSRAQSMATILREGAAAVRRGLSALPAVEPIEGLRTEGVDWPGLPSIFTFAVRDPADRRRLLSAAELRPLYEGLARQGVLLGQPVGLGAFGGLRIAFGARDADPSAADPLPRLFDRLGTLLDPRLFSRAPHYERAIR